MFQNLFSLLCTAESEVHYFFPIASDMFTMQTSYKTTPFSTIEEWIPMAILIILSVLADIYLHDWMASFGLGWVIPVVSGVSGALGVTSVVTTMVDVSLFRLYLGRYSSIRPSSMPSINLKEKKKKRASQPGRKYKFK